MRFELSAVAAEENHKASRADQAIAECIALPDIETCELDALQAIVTAELQDRWLRENKNVGPLQSRFEPSVFKGESIWT